jgi:hypothetical protein
MDERYPYIRFVIDTAQLIAGAVALVILLGGTAASCHHGGIGGLLEFLLTAAVAGLAYVAVMVRIDALRVLLDVERALREASPPGRNPSLPRADA